MEENLNSLISHIKSQILHERSYGKGKFRYSAELRRAVLDLIPKVGSQEACAKLLGLTASLIFRWRNEQNIPPPRRLVVTANKIPVPLSEVIKAEVVKLPNFDAVLANGITLKGLSLTSECLQILGGLK